LYVEDLKRGTNKDIGPKDIFEIASKFKAGQILTKSGKILPRSTIKMINQVPLAQQNAKYDHNGFQDFDTWSSAKPRLPRRLKSDVAGFQRHIKGFFDRAFLRPPF
jgi:hypothetical protein